MTSPQRAMAWMNPMDTTEKNHELLINTTDRSIISLI
jgi:hypothetical protein